VSEAHVHDVHDGHESRAKRSLKASSVGILGRAERLCRRADRITSGTDAFSTTIEALHSPVEATIDGRRMLLFGTNSYLGLNFHPDCIQAAIEATQAFGTGSTASRVAGGSTRAHVALEQEIAAFYRRQHAVVFSTGFMANLGVISSLVTRGDAVFLDAHCHASIVDAAKLSGADTYFFKHNDAQDLERLFAEAGVPGPRVLVAVEGVYSVHGDLADLQRLLTLAKSKGAVTLVDEAHGLGIYGKTGRGVVELSGTDSYADIIVGTFSKSIGVVGGFCVTDVHAIRGLKLMARTYIYTASLPPGVVAAARRSLQIIRTNSDLAAALWRNAEYLRSGLAAAGLDFSGQGPVGSIALPSQIGFSWWKRLLSEGIYVNLLIPPATPQNEAVLRLSVSAAHSSHHIERAVAAFGELAGNGFGTRHV
jgi:8-amino-7-oxononanoate synthase